ncbi:thiamine pyrophosphate-binding protein [Kibdelosporangium phytohabitans]|uniref:Acetolactate synthase n=1 Tax=Kibdelosporangium phytohabitans TaxID=860235 RepID=A0A0N9IA99_9PSEU|nr:thiamine pyrophosphate-binding protein [Kibdelosporangium phytohabitans]ALG11661.1 acetolactate synthase [Kibdelosporangium phytohabitans]MBE1463048.1 acetolactate synthase-1/2/3 large subunit [Kibdelosporangium phytohabitans]
MSRTGGDLVVESLVALGARNVFGLPGQHALGLFHALHRSSLRYFGSRTEVNAAFAADGHARTTGEVTPLLVSTGPGALQTLAGLQEAAASSVPVLGISSQIPSAGLGGARRGYLHELPDQQASFRDVVKHTRVVRAASQIPSAIAEAWRIAASAPTGPVWLEIPQDVLLGPAGVPVVTGLSAAPVPLAPRAELLAEAAKLLQEAQRPVILAGGGVVRGGAQPQLLELAGKLGSPVVSTFGGKGAFPWEHELSLQSWMEDRHTTDVLRDADVLLVVGSGLGELSSNYRTFRPRGRIVQIEADLGKLEANHGALGIHADARLALRALIPLVRQRDAVVPDLLTKVRDRLDSQDLAVERDVLAGVRDALPDDAPSFWDMTILAYWAWSAWDPRQAAMHTAQGAGGLGYAYPAALGAASTVDGPVLAVSGDGGAMYGLSELATATQYDLDVTWLIVDDGGYGILREYMAGAFGETNGTELTRPDFVALAESFGVPAVRTTPDRLRADLAEALAGRGPAVVVLPALLRMFAPTHLEQR